MKKILLPALALGAMSSAALAEPVAMTKAEMDEVTASGYAFVDAEKFVDIHENIDKKVKIDKFKDIVQKVDVQGYFAEADAGANCLGYGCESLTYAITDVNSFEGFTELGTPYGYATSVSGSEAAAPGFYFGDGKK